MSSSITRRPAVTVCPHDLRLDEILHDLSNSVGLLGGSVLVPLMIDRDVEEARPRETRRTGNRLSGEARMRAEFPFVEKI